MNVAKLLQFWKDFNETSYTWSPSSVLVQDMLFSRDQFDLLRSYGPWTAKWAKPVCGVNYFVKEFEKTFIQWLPSSVFALDILFSSPEQSSGWAIVIALRPVSGRSHFQATSPLKPLTGFHSNFVRSISAQGDRIIVKSYWLELFPLLQWQPGNRSQCDLLLLFFFYFIFFLFDACPIITW